MQDNDHGTPIPAWPHQKVYRLRLLLTSSPSDWGDHQAEGFLRITSHPGPFREYSSSLDARIEDDISNESHSTSSEGFGSMKNNISRDASSSSISESSESICSRRISTSSSGSPYTRSMSLSSQDSSNFSIARAERKVQPRSPEPYVVEWGPQGPRIEPPRRKIPDDPEELSLKALKLQRVRAWRAGLEEVNQELQGEIPSLGLPPSSGGLVEPQQGL
jgi:hypothetical protein